MAREVTIGERRFYIVSEPTETSGWKAQVLEVLEAAGDPITVGIETSGSTRSEADERALGVLQHTLRASETS
ncbi:MAG: hypothetical protein ND807_10015 [Vicinamibacterales bacterium]|nr:hypothetical protein [Vicinamibacterales bacterium]